MSSEEHLADLGEAARRAGSIVTEHINSIVEGAERQAQRITDDAEADAQRTRRDAVESARRLLAHLHALEQPLGQLVMNLQAEVDRVAGELGSGDYVDAHATAIPAAPEPPPAEAEVEPEPEPETPDPSPESPVPSPQSPEAESEEPEPVHAEPEPETPEAEVEAEPEEPEPVHVEPETPVPSPQSPEAESEREQEAPDEAESEPASGEAEPAPAVAGPTVKRPTATAEPGESRGLFARLRRSRSRAFISTQGYCAVCQRAFMAGSEENLGLSGWRVSGDVGLCPDCQSDGWQLPEGARLPFRRGGS